MDIKKLKIIDSHHHFWDLSMKKHPWLCERPLIEFRYGNYESCLLYTSDAADDP